METGNEKMMMALKENLQDNSLDFIKHLKLEYFDVEFKRRMLGGDCKAAYSLGVSLFVKKRHAEAKKVLQLAANAGHMESKQYLRLINGCRKKH